MTEKKSEHTSGDGRRSALKKLGVLSGVSATGAALPAKWTAPVVESVTLPAHAQTTTGEQDGVYGTALLVSSVLLPWWQRTNLLDGLLPEAQADHDDVAESACGYENDPGKYQIFISIQGSEVRICFSTSGPHQRCTGEAVTTISGTDIADTSIDPIDASIDEEEDQESVDFFDLMFIPSHPETGRPAISGTFRIRDFENLEDHECRKSFVADLIDGANYRCNKGCSEDDKG